MSEPTDDVEVVKKAIRSMKDDESGTENTFTAVSNALNRWGKYFTTDKRNVMVVVVTDEKGGFRTKPFSLQLPLGLSRAELQVQAATVDPTGQRSEAAKVAVKKK